MNFKPVPILSAMLLLACSPKAQTTQTAQNQPAITTNAECKNLHKVTDIDDLLHQMYTNIDSHCLFEMPTAELEKVWGIPILTGNEPNYDELFTKVNQKNTLYILKSWDYVNNNRHTFQMSINQSEFLEQNEPFWGGSIAQGQYPKLLPFPKMVLNKNVSSAQSCSKLPRVHKIASENILPTRYVEPQNIYQPSGFYFWENNHRNKKEFPILYMETRDVCGTGSMPFKIIFQQRKNSFYLK